LFDLSGESFSGQHFHVVRAAHQAGEVAEGVGHLRSAPRTLRLDRIDSARLAEATFQLREASELVPWAARAFATV
jgi:hypothetical protein